MEKKPNYNILLSVDLMKQYKDAYGFEEKISSRLFTIHLVYLGSARDADSIKVLQKELIKIKHKKLCIGFSSIQQYTLAGFTDNEIDDARFYAQTHRDCTIIVVTDDNDTRKDEESGTENLWISNIYFLKKSLTELIKENKIEGKSETKNTEEPSNEGEIEPRIEPEETDSF